MLKLIEENEIFTWSDALGYLGDGNHHWGKQDMINFLTSIQTELNSLHTVELLTIINSNNLAKKLEDKNLLEDLVKTLPNSKKREDVVNKILDSINELDDDVIELDFASEETKTNVDIPISEIDADLIDENTLPSDIDRNLAHEFNSVIEDIHSLDNDLLTISLDDENIKFLITFKINNLWNIVINLDKNNRQQLGEYLAKFKLQEGGYNFNLIRSTFFEEYNEVVSMVPSEDYIFQYEPNLMQKLMAFRIKNNKRYGNWSGTGAGKTLSAILAGRQANAKTTLIICNNATVSGWVKSINEYYKNNKIFCKTKLNDVDDSLYSYYPVEDIRTNPNDNNYIILNYETFQLVNSGYMASELINNNNIDYIILDEVQNAKQRDEIIESNRRNVINGIICEVNDKNEDLLLTVMSATPVINGLTEPKKLLELLTSKEYNDLNTKTTVNNGIEMYKHLTRLGLRYKPNNSVNIVEIKKETNGDELLDELLNTPKGNVAQFEKILLDKKLDIIKSDIKPGCLIYTHLITGFVNEIKDYVENLGFSAGLYTGDDKSGLELFKEGKIDVLIGSAPVTTGVDGIQKVCNRLIPVVLPWTSSEYEQLKGRINRQGSIFTDADIIIPIVNIDMDDKKWSWDNRKKNIIERKASISDLALDGIIPEGLTPSNTTLLEMAKEELKNWIDRIKGDTIHTVDRKEITVPLTGERLEKARHTLGDFSEYNKRWNTSNSSTMQKEFMQDVDKWNYYHTVYREARKSWTEIPYKLISKEINSLRLPNDAKICDLGCGENLIKNEVNFEVIPLDLVAIDDSVIECNINEHIPLEDNSIDVAVFSLSLMSRDYLNALDEAYRCLRRRGTLFIAEPKTKFENQEEHILNRLNKLGFNEVRKELKGSFYFLEFIKG